MNFQVLTEFPLASIRKAVYLLSNIPAIVLRAGDLS
jgi:hypothetical protein